MKYVDVASKFRNAFIFLKLLILHIVKTSSYFAMNKPTKTLYIRVKNGFTKNSTEFKKLLTNGS